METKFPQITRRKIGSVVILDIKGELVGPWALKAKDNIARLISGHVNNLIINLKELNTVDSLGVKALASNLVSGARNVVIGGRTSVMEMFTHNNAFSNCKVFMDENAVIDYFGKEFVDRGDESDYVERRVYNRLKTAIPLEFWYEDEKGKKIVFKAIITDISEGGLLAEYLDLETVDIQTSKLDPYDLKMLHLKIKLPKYDYIYATGKVVRTIMSGSQLALGIEFYDIDESDKAKIAEFLA